MEDGYTFQYRHKGTTKTLKLADNQDLTEMCDEFELFLRGVGFIFDGSVEIVEPDDEPNEKLKELMKEWSDK